MFFFLSRSNNRLGLLIECSKLTCFAREKATWFLGGEIDDRRRLLSGVLAGRRASWKREKRSRTSVQTQNTKKKTIIDTRIRVQTSTSSTAEFEAPPAECSMHAPAHAVVWHSIDPALHAVLPRHLHASTGLSEGFFCWVEGRCYLAPADQVSSESTTKLTSDKSMFGGGRRITASVRTARTVSKDANFDAPCGGFDSFSSLGLFFFGNNVLWTTVWSLSIVVSFNLQDGRTLLTCPFLASWTAFVCACNGGRTRRASKRRPRAAEVMARSRHVLRVLQVRCLPLRHFQVLAFERSTMTKM